MTNSLKRALEKAVKASDPAPLVEAFFKGTSNVKSAGDRFGEQITFEEEKDLANRLAQDCANFYFTLFSVYDSLAR